MACVEMAWIKFGFGSALGWERSAPPFVVVMAPLLSLLGELRTRGSVFGLHVTGWEGWFCHWEVGVGGLVCPGGLDGRMGFVGCVVVESIDVLGCFIERREALFNDRYLDVPRVR
jgi:hypothetical protein